MLLTTHPLLALLELYLYQPSGPHRACKGITLPLHFFTNADPPNKILGEEANITKKDSVHKFSNGFQSVSTEHEVVNCETSIIDAYREHFCVFLGGCTLSIATENLSEHGKEKL